MTTEPCAVQRAYERHPGLEKLVPQRRAYQVWEHNTTLSKSLLETPVSGGKWYLLNKEGEVVSKLRPQSWLWEADVPDEIIRSVDPKLARVSHICCVSKHWPFMTILTLYKIPEDKEGRAALGL